MIQKRINVSNINNTNNRPQFIFYVNGSNDAIQNLALDDENNDKNIMIV